MFWTSPGPSSGGTTVFLRHTVFVVLKQMDILKLLMRISSYIKWKTLFKEKQ